MLFLFFLVVSTNINFLLTVKVLLPFHNYKEIKVAYFSNTNNRGYTKKHHKKIYFLFNRFDKTPNKRKRYIQHKNEYEDSTYKTDKEIQKEEENPEKNNKELLSCFDDYFNKESPKYYAQLEAKKLEIIKENIQSNKKEIREALKRSYKSDYKKLLKEEEEDAQLLSDKIYEGIKITFHMNENINNVLFTQYSNMISKLKETSSILKNLRNTSVKDMKENTNNVIQQIHVTKEKEENKEKSEHSEINETVYDHKKHKFDVAKENISEDLEKSDKKNIADEIIQNVHFFKPEKYENIERARTFSDKLFSNIKLETSTFKSFNNEQMDIENEKEAEEEMEEEVLLDKGISPLQMLKENVKNCLQYKTENIIKNNLSEDHLHGRLKVHWFPKFMRRTIERIPEFIKISDIIIEVRNSVIPFVFDDLYSLNIFNFITNKPKIIVYTRSDIASAKGNEEWGHYYRRKLFWADKNFNKNISKEYENQMKKSAVIFVDAKNGGKEIITLKKLINKLCSNVIEKKKKQGIINYKIKCIFLGLPNVGKSALINRLLNLKKTKSYDTPGVTKVIQMYSSKKYELIDTPGLLADNLYKVQERLYDKNNSILEKIYHFNANDYLQNNIVNIKNYSKYMHIENNIYLLALCNHISPQSYDIYNIAEVLIYNIYNSYIYNNEYIDFQKIVKRYNINFTECINNDGMFSAFHFIQKLARDKFQNDLNKASMRLVSDFRKNYLGKMTLNYPLYFNKKKITMRVSRKIVQQNRDQYVGW